MEFSIVNLSAYVSLCFNVTSCRPRSLPSQTFEQNVFLKFNYNYTGCADGVYLKACAVNNSQQKKICGFKNYIDKCH